MSRQLPSPSPALDCTNSVLCSQTWKPAHRAWISHTISIVLSPSTSLYLRMSSIASPSPDKQPSVLDPLTAVLPHLVSSPLTDQECLNSVLEDEGFRKPAP